MSQREVSDFLDAEISGVRDVLDAEDAAAVEQSERATLPDIIQATEERIYEQLQPVVARLYHNNVEVFRCLPTNAFDQMPRAMKGFSDLERRERWRKLRAYLTEFCKLDLGDMLVKQDQFGEALCIQKSVNIADKVEQEERISELPAGVVWVDDLTLKDCTNLRTVAKDSFYGGDLIVFDCPQLKLPVGLNVAGDLHIGVENLQLPTILPRKLVSDMPSHLMIKNFLAQEMKWKIGGAVILNGLEEMEEMFMALNDPNDACFNVLVENLVDYFNTEPAEDWQKTISRQIFWQRFVLVLEMMEADLNTEITQMYSHAYPGKTLNYNSEREMAKKLKPLLGALPSVESLAMATWLQELGIIQK